VESDLLELLEDSVGYLLSGQISSAVV